MRSPIPKEIREQLADDPMMKDCAAWPFYPFDCKGRIEWHHWSYAGKRRNELYTLVPLCHFHHEHVGRDFINQIVNAFIKARIRHFKAEKEFAQKYPRSNLLPTLKVDIIKR